MLDINYDPEAGWMQEAACKNSPADFYDESEYSRKYLKKYYCDECPVADQCLAYALQRDESGFWGGLTERQRRALKKRLERDLSRWQERMKEQSRGA